MRRLRRKPLSVGSATGSGMEGHHIFTTVFHFYHVAAQKSVTRLGISVASQPLHLMQKRKQEENMTTAQPDKTGLHILLKLAALVVILAGIHAAADIIVQLLLALFFAIVLNPLVTRLFAGEYAARLPLRSSWWSCCSSSRHWSAFWRRRSRNSWLCYPNTTKS